MNCPSLEKITVPDSVTYIGYNAFERCHNISDHTITIRCTKQSYAYHYAQNEGVLTEVVSKNVSDGNYQLSLNTNGGSLSANDVKKRTFQVGKWK